MPRRAAGVFAPRCQRLARAPRRPTPSRNGVAIAVAPRSADPKCPMQTWKALSG